MNDSTLKRLDAGWKRWLNPRNPLMTTDDYRPSLKMVGVALIAVGVIDIGWTIYWVIHGSRDISISNIFAVIAGILLIRGGLRTANVVAFVGAMTLSGCIGVTVLTPMVIPLDLICTYWKLRFLASLGSLFFAIAVSAFSLWVYKCLTMPSIAAAIAEKYPTWTSWWRRPRTGFTVGLILVIGSSVVLIPSMHGKTADRAEVEARRKVGGRYKFAVTEMHTFTTEGITEVTGVVTAYNDKEIRTIPVTWQQ